MAAKRVVRHRIWDLATTMILIAILTTVRSALFPFGDESVSNTPTPIGDLLQGVQASFPVLSIVLWGFMLFIAALDAGRYGPKYALYPAYTLMAIPIFGVLAGGVMVSGDYLLTTVAMFTMLLATKYMIRCVQHTDSFNDLSLSMFCYGLLPLVLAPSALLYVVLPLLLFVVRSSWRDWVVAITSLFFPLLSVSYWSWCAGEGFLSVGEQLYASTFTPSEFSFFSTLNIASMLVIGVLIVMFFCAILLIVSDKYSLRVKSRSLMRYNALLLVATISMFFLPSASASLFALVAVPASLLLPLIFVRMGVGFTEMLYRLMLIAAVANLITMCWS